MTNIYTGYIEKNIKEARRKRKAGRNMFICDTCGEVCPDCMRAGFSGTCNQCQGGQDEH